MRRGNCKVIHGFLLVPLVLVAQSWQLCHPMDCSLPGSSVHGIVQARILEWVAILFSRGSSQPSNWTGLSLIAGRFFTIWATNSRAGCNHFQDRQRKLVISAICSDASGILWPQGFRIERFWLYQTHTMIVPSSRLSQRRHWLHTPVLLPGKSHGQRSLVGCSPEGREESDMAERLHFHFSLSCIGEGNGTPLQCSCLEIPGMGSHRVGHDWSELAVSSSKVIRKMPWIPWLLRWRRQRWLGGG